MPGQSLSSPLGSCKKGLLTASFFHQLWNCNFFFFLDHSPNSTLCSRYLFFTDFPAPFNHVIVLAHILHPIHLNIFLITLFNNLFPAINYPSFPDPDSCATSPSLFFWLSLFSRTIPHIYTGYPCSLFQDPSP